MFRKFEGFTQAFPKQEPDQPPIGVFAFCRYYTRGFGRPLIIMSLLSTIIAVVEVSLFGAMGQLVDWLSKSDPATFWHENSRTLIGYSLLLLVIMPVLIIVFSLITHQTLLGNYPMSIRWLAHRYLLKQSLPFYQE